MINILIFIIIAIFYSSLSITTKFPRVNFIKPKISRNGRNRIEICFMKIKYFSKKCKAKIETTLYKKFAWNFCSGLVRQMNSRRWGEVCYRSFLFRYF